MSKPYQAGENGFTIVEVLVALGISAMVMTGLTATMRTVDLGWRASVAAVGRQEAVATALRVVAGDIARIERVVGQGYEFKGNSSWMSYVILERPEAGADGLYRIRLRAGDGLVRDRVAYAAGSPTPEWGGEAVVLNGTFRVGLSYRAPSAGLREWRDEWHDRDRLPEQVRVEIRDADSRSTVVPALILPLKISAEGACVAPEAEGCSLKTGGRLVRNDG